MTKISKVITGGLLAASVLVSGAVTAKSKVVQVTASGLTKEIAIEQGLIRAVSQVSGVDVKSISSRAGLMVRANGKTATEIATMNTTSMVTQGQVKTYEVVDESCSEVNCEVTLNVEVPYYKSPGLSPDKRRKLVVVPFKGINGRQFTQHLQTLLVQSRRFAVLDRELDHLYQKEKRLLLSPDTAIGEKMRLGQVLGLDYIIVGDVAVEQSGGVETITLTGETESTLAEHSVVNYKVINLATRQIKWQDQAVVEGSVEYLDTVKPIASAITSAIYPIKIVSSNAQQVILNQGAKSVEVGSVFDVFALGEKIIDPYTKESLGREEIFVGQIEVNRVTNKMSYASVLSGAVENMKVKSIVRPAMPQYDENMVDTYQEPVKSTVKASSAGGILLPGVKTNKPKPSPKGGVVINK